MQEDYEETDHTFFLVLSSVNKFVTVRNFVVINYV